MASEFTVTGNECKVVLDGVEAALVQNISGSSDYGHEPVSGVGDIHVKEYVPAMARHNVTIDKMIFRKDDLVARNIIFENGDAALKGKTFDIEIFSKEGPLLQKYIRATNTGGRIAVAAHRITVLDAQFAATDVEGTLSIG